MKSSSQEAYPSGSLSWMAQHPVAANLLMLVFVLGGLAIAFRVTQEVFPEFTVDMISVSMPYPGASPEEVEQGILLSIEDEVRGLDGVKRVTSIAYEGQAALSIELLTGANQGKALQDVKNAVDRIQSFPEDAERPIVSLVQSKRRVLSLIVYGGVEESALRDLAEKVRSDLLQEPGITLAELDSARPLEIAIEVPQRYLRSYDLTLPQIAEEVRQAAIELPAGGVKAEGGEVLLRTQERRDYGREFRDIALKSYPDGSTLMVGDIATIRDTFEDTDKEATFHGKPSLRLDVYRVGSETPQSVSQTVKAFAAKQSKQLPAGIGMAIWDDRSEVYQDRMDLLLRNAAIGLVLVLLLLGLFLDPKLAFWVMLGIPISILGSFLFIPVTGATINMISLFAFIVTLGIVVDDAIVVGENIYEKREQGVSFQRASIEGVREISGPVVFAILTNIVAFLPMFFVPGASGNLFRQIPSVTVVVFAISLVESLFVLPAHLSHSQQEENAFWRVLSWPRRHFSVGLHYVTQHLFGPLLDRALHFRYATIAAALACLLVAGGVVIGGHLPFHFLPRIDSEVVTAQARLPFGVPIEASRAVREALVAGVQKTLEANGGEGILRGVYTQIGRSLKGFGPGGSGQGGGGGSHLVGVQVLLVPLDQRKITGIDFAKQWRQEVGSIMGLETLTFSGDTGVGEGSAIQIELSHRHRETLEAAALELAGLLQHYAGVTDIDSGVSQGKPQMSFHLKPEGRSLGLNAMDVAQQVRAAFYGAEALRQQRGRNEVKVKVRLPEEERHTYHTVERFMLRTPQGGEVPLAEAVHIEQGRAYTEINRRHGQRVIAVTADVDEKKGNANLILQDLQAHSLPALLAKYSGLSYSFEGKQADQAESLTALGGGFLLALFAIYALLAVAFQSYFQPLIVMLAIPFGIIGAIGGHFLLGYSLSIISLFGIVALAGVVVNDSLVLVVTANEMRSTELCAHQAVFLAAKRRFRPIWLTSLTTFLGLAPMIFETSMQARFLIPMAISLGCGVLFATAIILILVPAVYLVLEDVAEAWKRLRNAMNKKPPSQKASRVELNRSRPEVSCP